MEGNSVKVKDKVLAILEKNKGEHISGNEIAKNLDVSRNSIWKAIKQLQDEGHQIIAVTNKGYCLDIDNDLISVQSIRKYLPSDFFKIDVRKVVDSTNTQLKIKAEAGAPEGTLIISEQQTKGRGRMERNFYSPKNTGIYMSLLLRPNLSIHESLNITTCAAVAVAQAIEMNSDIKAEIKWVNDIFINDKKVCGILTEASMDLEGGGLSYAILGIGINVFMPSDGFPKELGDIPTSIFNKNKNSGDRRSKLITDILKIFMKYYKDIEKKAFLDEYKKRSMVLGKEIKVIKGETIEEAIALDIDEDFRLKVKNQDGKIEYLTSGEVSVRRKEYH